MNRGARRVAEDYEKWIISHLVDRNYIKALTRARKERQIAPQASAGYGLDERPCWRSAKRSGGMKDILRRLEMNTPAKTKKRYVPHDCKRSEFSCGPLGPQLHLRTQAYFPSTKWEMTLKN